MRFRNLSLTGKEKKLKVKLQHSREGTVTLQLTNSAHVALLNQYKLLASPSVTSIWKQSKVDSKFITKLYLMNAGCS